MSERGDDRVKIERTQVGIDLLQKRLDGGSGFSVCSVEVFLSILGNVLDALRDITKKESVETP